MLGFSSYLWTDTSDRDNFSHASSWNIGPQKVLMHQVKILINLPKNCNLKIFQIFESNFDPMPHLGFWPYLGLFCRQFTQLSNGTKFDINIWGRGGVMALEITLVSFLGVIFPFFRAQLGPFGDVSHPWCFTICFMFWHTLKVSNVVCMGSSAKFWLYLVKPIFRCTFQPASILSKAIPGMHDVNKIVVFFDAEEGVFYEKNTIC